MSVCPVCQKQVRKNQANRKKIGGTWIHKHNSPHSRAKRARKLQNIVRIRS